MEVDKPREDDSDIIDKNGIGRRLFIPDLGNDVVMYDDSAI
jgi:hypothetical protein